MLMFDSPSFEIDPEDSGNGVDVCISLLGGTVLERNVHFSLVATTEGAGKSQPEP